MQQKNDGGVNEMELFMVHAPTLLRRFKSQKKDLTRPKACGEWPIILL